MCKKKQTQTSLVVGYVENYSKLHKKIRTYGG